MKISTKGEPIKNGAAQAMHLIEKLHSCNCCYSAETENIRAIGIKSTEETNTKDYSNRKNVCGS